MSQYNGYTAIQSAVLLTGVLCTFYISGASSYPNGAPIDQCESMQPGIYTHGEEQQTPSPYNLTIYNDKITAGELIAFHIVGPSLRGLLLEAIEDKTGRILGKFYELPLTVFGIKYRFKTIDCNGPASAVTHFDATDKYDPFQFQWKSPIDASGNVTFRATIVKDKLTYWRNVIDVAYVEPLGNCTELDRHLYDDCLGELSFLGDLDDAVYNPEGVCSEVDLALNKTISCLRDYVKMCAEVGDKADRGIYRAANSSLDWFSDLRDDIYNNICDECGLAEANDCFYELNAIDPSDFESTCSSFVKTDTCMADLRSKCDVKNRTVGLTADRDKNEAATTSLQTNLHQCQLYESCPTVVQKNKVLESCVQIAVSNPLSFDNVCSLLESYTNCLVEASDGCMLLDELLSRHRSILTTLRLGFGCRDANDSLQDAGCNVRRVLECYNPVFEHLSVSSIDSTSDLLSQLSALKDVVGSVTDLLQGSVCSNIEALLVNATTCFIDESMKCERNPLLQEFEISIPIEELQDFAYAPLVAINSSVNFESLTEAVNTVHQLTSTANQLTEHLKLLCEEECADSEQRLLDFQACFQDSENILEVASEILYEYQKEFQKPDSCQLVVNYTQCAVEHLTGCGYTELSIAPNNDIRLYQAMHICDVDAHINFREDSACLDGDYNNYLLRSSELSCKAITRQELQDLTAEGICKRLHERAECFLEMVPCCGAKQRVLEPYLFSISLFSEWLKCDTMMNYTSFLVKQPFSDGCDLQEIFECYNPLLDVLEYNSKYYSSYAMERFSEIQVYYQSADQRQTCPTEDIFQSIEECVVTNSTECQFSPICLNQNIAVSNASKSMPFEDYTSFQSNQHMCGPDCEGTDVSLEGFAECEIEEFTLNISAVVWKEATGVDYTSQCSSLSNAMNCIRDTMASCEAMKVYIKEHLESYPIHEASLLCDLNMTFLASEEALDWDILEFTTLPPPPPATTVEQDNNIISRASPGVYLSGWLFIALLFFGICL